MSGDFSQFLDTFFEESAEHIVIMEEGLLGLEQRPDDLDLLNRIFRAAHSIKGNCGMFGFTALQQFTHKMETVLDLLRTGRLAVDKPTIDVLLHSTDAIKSLIEAARTQTPSDETVVAALAEKLSAMSGAPEKGSGAFSEQGAVGARHAVPPQKGARYRIAWTPSPDLFRRGLDPGAIFRDLAGLGAVPLCVADTGAVPHLQTIDPERCYLSWTLEIETPRPVSEIEAVFEFVREGGELSIVALPPSIPDVGARHAVPLQEKGPTPDGEPARKRLGDILVEEGVVSQAQVAAAAAKQKKIGEILIEEGIVPRETVEQALEKQRQLEKSRTAEAPRSGKAETSIRVETTKIDRLINLVGELVITQSMISDLGHTFDMDKLPMLLERVVQLERNTREIQERVMAVRMVPIGSVFNRFPRLVRDLSSSSQKKVRLLISGEETELDKSVIESIGDPLTHLIRNSVDHGLESSDGRRAAGKPEEGTVSLNAYHQGGTICITVEDDGRGLNREKITAKAVAQGLIASGEGLSDEAVWPLIFRPGFSTADKVTDVSGRGVGMDVVKRNIEGLGGNVSIETRAGKGSRFTLKLPLTLAIIDGMSVRVGPEIYIVPLTSIIESIRPRRSDLKTIVGRGEVISVRGDYIPVVRLHQAFAGRADVIDATQAVVMIVESEGERVALLVDELLGQQQVVIKNLNQNFRKVEGIAGATILGNGQVALIIDVRGLLAVSRGECAVAA